MLDEVQRDKSLRVKEGQRDRFRWLAMLLCYWINVPVPLTHAISQNTSSTTFPFPFRGYGHTHFWPSLFINQFKQIGCIRKFQISSSCLFQLCECPFKTPCNEPQLPPCRRHISLCIFSGVELKLFHWECLFLVSYGNIKRKPGFFTSTESGRGITGTALQIYKLYLDSAIFSCKTWSSWHILAFMRVRGQIPDSFLS